MNPAAQRIAKAARGDVRAFRELYDLHRVRVTSQVSRLLGRSADVEDCVQEVFVRLYRALPGFAGESAFETWLYRLVRNTTIDFLRARRRPVDLTALRLLREGGEPWSQLEARDLIRILHAALEGLPEEAREAFLLYEVEGLTLQQIGELTDCSLNTVAARVRRTRERVASVLAQASSTPRAAGQR